MSKYFVLLCFLWIGFMLLGAYFFMGCTINLQNTDTHGRTEDLIDEQMSTTPTVSTDFSFPVG